jgi:hypothetical protein
MQPIKSQTVKHKIKEIPHVEIVTRKVYDPKTGKTKTVKEKVTRIKRKHVLRRPDKSD